METTHHDNYHRIDAETPEERGEKFGHIFGAEVRQLHTEKSQQQEDWAIQRTRALTRLAITQQYFPQYITELKAYAETVGIPFEDLWTLSLESETENLDNEDHCTTMVTMEKSTQRLVLAQNEDWDVGSEHVISIVEVHTPKGTLFQLYYRPTLGGNSVSINNHGIIHAVNSLPDGIKDSGGIPRNVLARALSESKNPLETLQWIKGLRRSAAYNHTLVDTEKKKIWQAEITPNDIQIKSRRSGYIHANHPTIGHQETGQRSSSNSHRRLIDARSRAKGHMTEGEIRAFLTHKGMQDKQGQYTKGVLNNRTIAQIMIDRAGASIHLVRETEKGWVDYPFEFIR